MQSEVCYVQSSFDTLSLQGQDGLRVLFKAEKFRLKTVKNEKNLLTSRLTGLRNDQPLAFEQFPWQRPTTAAVDMAVAYHGVWYSFVFGHAKERALAVGEGRTQCLNAVDTLAGWMLKDYTTALDLHNLEQNKE